MKLLSVRTRAYSPFSTQSGVDVDGYDDRPPTPVSDGFEFSDKRIERQRGLLAVGDDCGL
jgi:hypothetical protein